MVPNYSPLHDFQLVIFKATIILMHGDLQFIGFDFLFRSLIEEDWSVKQVDLCPKNPSDFAWCLGA